MPNYDFRAPRLLVEGPIEAISAILPTPEQINYLVSVLRLKDGADVLLFDGRSGEWHARLGLSGRRDVRLQPTRQLREQTSPSRLHYLFAPLKHARLDYMMQKATEMGAGVLQPVLTQHTQGTRFNVERARANAAEAAEQCGILCVPECRDPVRLADLLAGWNASRTLVFCDERADASSALDTLRTVADRDLAILIGPEGGFSEDERRALQAAPFTLSISLGPRILRADTAAVAALALVQAAAGDWRAQTNGQSAPAPSDAEALAPPAESGKTAPSMEETGGRRLPTPRL